MKKFLIIILILFLAFGGYILYDTVLNDKGIPVLEIEEKVVNINKLYIYGTHLNVEGSGMPSRNAKLVMYNGEFKEITVNGVDDFNLSDKVNDGLYLDNISRGDYFLFFRDKYTNEKNEEAYKYYAIKNNTDYKETTYYTMSSFNNKIVIDSEETYPTMMIHVTENKDSNIYDIVIDPGHGGLDGGATRYGSKETDFTMDIAQKLKTSLEKTGFKVKLTREEGQIAAGEKMEEYGTHGRAVVPREVNAKYLFSIHINSNTYSSVKGLEVYTAHDINYDFSKLLVDKITASTGLEVSNNKVNKISDGIYNRTFTTSDIESSLENYQKKNLNAYDITTNSNYYYIIRETGGIITGAYVDDRNDSILGNPYYKSNVGTEAYLTELGYISNKENLDNLISNLDKYVEGLTNAINTLYDVPKKEENKK